MAFKCFTVNVRNDQDEALLGFLDSDVFKAGLQLAASVQPAIAPFSRMVLGLTKSIATRSRNVPVQDFYLGLAFSVSRQDEPPPGRQRRSPGRAVKPRNAGPSAPGLVRAPRPRPRQKS